MKRPAVYIMANKCGGTIYPGVTSTLPQRVCQHREGLRPGFTARYRCNTLVWFELHGTMEGAIAREKQIKVGSRRRKVALIGAINPNWRDLFDDLF
jgi:putative endonuclease